MRNKCILNPTIARQLLHKGHVIVDIKPKKENPRETVFIFKDTEQFQKDLKEILEK